MIIHGTHGEVLLGDRYPVNVTVTHNRIEIRSGPECWSLSMTREEFDRFRNDITGQGKHQLNDYLE